MSKYVVHNTTN